MRRSIGLPLAALLSVVGCYGPPRTRPDRVTLQAPGATQTVSWGREHLVDLVQDEGRLYVLANEQSRCRKFTSGTLEVVDAKRRTKTSHIRGRQVATSMVLGGALAFAFLIIPPVIDKPYRSRDLALMGVGAGVFVGSAIAVLVDRALPSSKIKPIVRTTDGGRWEGDAEACGAPRVVDQPMRISASDGETQMSWVVQAEGQRTELSTEIFDSIESWANACQVEIQLDVGFSGDPIPADLGPYEQERAGRVGMGDYNGGNAIEQGSGAGSGHDTVYGRGDRLVWKPDPSRTKPRVDARLTEPRPPPIEACLNTRQREFEERCRAQTREASRGECEAECNEDRDLQGCTWLREDCDLLGGTSLECSIVHDKCLRDKKLDPPNLERCANACIDKHPSVVRSHTECRAQWAARP